MTTGLLIIAYAEVLGAVALVALARKGRTRRARVRNRQLAAQNRDMRALIRHIEIDGRVQLAAGNQAFEHPLRLIADSGFAGDYTVTTARKEH